MTADILLVLSPNLQVWDTRVRYKDGADRPLPLPVGLLPVSFAFRWLATPFYSYGDGR